MLSYTSTGIQNSTHSMNWETHAMMARKCKLYVALIPGLLPPPAIDRMTPGGVKGHTIHCRRGRRRGIEATLAAHVWLSFHLHTLGLLMTQSLVLPY